MRRPLAGLVVILSGIVLTVSSGCYHMYSQPYGYSSGAPMGTTYPGTMQYGAPIQTLTPGQPYVPGGTYQALPPGSAPTYQGGGLQPIPETNAPTYQNTTPATPNTNTNTNPKTPDPYFPNTYNAPTGLKSIQPTAFQEPAPLSPPTASLREVRSVPTDGAPRTIDSTPAPVASVPATTGLLPNTATANAPSASSMAAPVPAAGLMPLDSAVPMDSVSSKPAQASAASQAPATREDFALPVMSPPPAKSAAPVTSAPQQFPETAIPAGASSLFDVETKKVVTADQTVFGHDPQFQWLRGVLAKDSQTGAWTIVYNDQPETGDRWSGHLSLSSSPYLENLRDGDVVEVQGHLDDVIHDRQGRPVYSITSLKKPFAAQK